MDVKINTQVCHVDVEDILKKHTKKHTHHPDHFAKMFYVSPLGENLIHRSYEVSTFLIVAV